jgi:HSP20 family protein
MDMNQYLSGFPTDLFAEFDRLQHQMDDVFRGFGSASDIRATGRNAFPAINIGATDAAVEIIALAPGIDPAKIDISIDKGLLTVSGERPAELPAAQARTSVYARERFAGPFRRVISLPDDIDPDRVEARYLDGCLRVTIQKRESSKPRSIRVQ